jgi:hypothetical protein
MIKKIILISIMLVAGISSCIAPAKFIVTSVGEEPEVYKERVIYSLPRTVLLVKINFEKTNYIPGPYRRYSEKYLGIVDFIDKAETKWSITGSEVNGFNEPDPLHFYSINIINGSFQSSRFLELSESGLIVDPDKGDRICLPVPGNDKIIEPPYFTDISTEENFNEISDTLFKTIIKDTSFVKIPVVRKQREAKTLEQKAEAAANFIISIRKKRFKMETGGGDIPIFPDGMAMETSIQELNKLEKEYISLFIGKIYTRKYSRGFFITPFGTPENITFLKFSAAEGILSADSPKGEALNIEISLLGITDLLKNNLPQTPTENVFNTLYYRIPEHASIKIILKDKLISEGRFTLFQAGSLMSLPTGGK